jgi:hypothetical protein
MLLYFSNRASTPFYFTMEITGSLQSGKGDGAWERSKISNAKKSM